MKLTKVKLNLPFGIGGVEIDATDAERNAAWVLYVQFTTRNTLHQPFDPALESIESRINALMALYNITRECLLDAGPNVYHGPNSLGPLAIRIIREGISPFVSKWFAKIMRYKDTQPAEQSDAIAYEHSWDDYEEIVSDYNDTQRQLVQFLGALEKLAGIVNDAET